MVRIAPPPRYVAVPAGASRRWRGGRVLLAVVWLASVLVAWFVAERQAAPALAETRAALAELRRESAAQRRELERLRQRETLLARSDEISRRANRDVQRQLTERDAEIAHLRENLAFYERLVGASGERRPLTVHTAQFRREAGGTWRYQVTLTQSLNRGAISEGALRLAVEGVRDGRLATLGWDELHQRRGAPAQRYAFRYFQQLEGSVMLPAGFTPQRVRVSLSGDGGPVEQTFAWADTAGGGDARRATFH
ncbi:MAG TPA: DUF6776 family protein [Lysobacter sp.]|nr:DUF6776 family protein [Lysobacter sp.]